jgi:nucleoside-diphosphate-sugar epimerase
VFCWFHVRVSEEQDVTKCKSEITFHPLPRDDPKRRCPDTNKLEKLVQWKPTVSFEEGLKKTITWFTTTA